MLLVLISTDHKEVEQLEERRNVGGNSCNCGDGNGSKGPILDVYDDDDDDVCFKVSAKHISFCCMH
jgi:hypothetical protein